MRVLMSNWQEELANGFQTAAELLRYLELPAELGSKQAEIVFKTKVPRAFVNRMKKGSPCDPLLQQVLAIDAELYSSPSYRKDPLDERRFNPLPGLIHKYQSRVLLMLSGACAINCRYCFRRHFPYQDNRPGKEGLAAIHDYINARPEIDEVILSGGDPLILNNHYFKNLLDMLKPIAHIKTLRIHSRIPIVLPSRIEDSWLKLMASTHWQKVMVTHCNHPQEIDEEVKSGITRLKAHDWTVLNQAVLLKGVNDKLKVQVNLAKTLFANGILPYYLHLLDPVEGAMHFDSMALDAKTLYQQMQKFLPGYLLPRLVQELPGELHKSLVKLS
ncbi:MAG: EF-P beta-lysylation protein EpmB [Gammaproteobacteria bacterium]|nr:EF-P beta-lysylation protein EpmB [Gammaproteobacteria bacterium]